MPKKKIAMVTCLSFSSRRYHPDAGEEERRAGLGPNLGVYDVVRDRHSFPRAAWHLRQTVQGQGKHSKTKCRLSGKGQTFPVFLWCAFASFASRLIIQTPGIVFSKSG